MNTTIQILQKHGFNTDCVTRCVQDVHQYLIDAVHPLKTAQKLIRELTDITVQFEDELKAIRVAQYVANDALTMDQYNKQQSIDSAFIRADKLNVDHPWARVEKEYGQPSVESAVVDGIDVKVKVKADGKIKKGGKQILAAELYKKHVVDATTPLTNQEFIALLMKELGMTKAGATTYRYNMAKKFSQ